MKKLISLVLAACLVCGLTACGGSTGTSESDAAGERTAEEVSEDSSVHKIGVLVYNRTDDEVIAFKDYLENYIESCFEDVDFLYSDGSKSIEDSEAFIQSAAENGVEGIMSFITYDLEAEVNLCAENHIYYMLASGSVSDDAFAKAADNEYFLGVVGPGSEIEYQAGYEMGAYFAENGGSDEYFILSGGASMGNEMHRQRAIGMLDALQEAYGVTFDRETSQLAELENIEHVQAGDLTVCICPGYMSREEQLKAAQDEYEADQFSVVMSTLAVADMQERIAEAGAKLGMVDCYSETNWQLFNGGELNYLVGKYRSIIGPSFAAMYNAVNGYAEDFLEDDGKAFHVTQGFWTSDSAEDCAEKFEMSSSIAINAYNYEDLYHVCKNYNPDATLEDLKALAGAYSFEEAQARRAE